MLARLLFSYKNWEYDVIKCEGQPITMRLLSGITRGRNGLQLLHRGRNGPLKFTELSDAQHSTENTKLVLGGAKKTTGRVMGGGGIKETYM